MTADQSTPAAKITCGGVWKVFGAGADRFLAAHDNAPSDEALAEAGLIGAVRDASFAVGAGEIFVIMGLSGSGKSTLVRCMSRLIEPNAGEVVFEGRDLLKASAKELIACPLERSWYSRSSFAWPPTSDRACAARSRCSEKRRSRWPRSSSAGTAR